MFLSHEKVSGACCQFFFKKIIPGDAVSAVADGCFARKSIGGHVAVFEVARGRVDVDHSAADHGLLLLVPWRVRV